MHATLLARFVEARWGEHVTNATHDNAVGMLHRMMFMAHTSYMDAPTLAAHSDGAMHPTRSRYDSLSLCSLIYMCLCPEVFVPPPAPRTPEDPALKAQRLNAAILASEMVEKFRLAQGQDWDCWLEVNMEMEDLIANNDDIPSVMRELLQKAEEFGGIHDPSFAELRRSFFSPPFRSPNPNDDSQTRPHWFNLGNGSAMFNEDTGAAFWPGNPDCREFDGRLPLLSVLDPDGEVVEGAQRDPRRQWMEGVIPKLRAYLEEMRAIHGEDWLTSSKGGSLLPGDESEYWIGLSVAGDRQGYCRDAKDWVA